MWTGSSRQYKFYPIVNLCKNFSFDNEKLTVPQARIHIPLANNQSQHDKGNKTEVACGSSLGLLFLQICH